MRLSNCIVCWLFFLLAGILQNSVRDILERDSIRSPKFKQLKADEITRILLSLAVTARVVDDREQQILLGLLVLIAGYFRVIYTISATEVLEIREACNKLIHAKTVRFDVEELGVQRYLNPIIYLYGSFHGKEWKAQLDIIKFLKPMSLCLRFLVLGAKGMLRKLRCCLPRNYFVYVN